MAALLIAGLALQALALLVFLKVKRQTLFSILFPATVGLGLVCVYAWRDSDFTLLLGQLVLACAAILVLRSESGGRG